MISKSSLGLMSSCAMMTLAMLTLLLHGRNLQGFWRVDDPLILNFVTAHRNPINYFFSSEAWRMISTNSFTPWLALEYWIDSSLFGLNPTFFYAHHLLHIWLAACLTYVLLLRNVNGFWGCFAAGLFLIGAPTSIVAQQIMSRHYVTGLIFSIVAILFWLHRKGRTESHFFIWGSAVFYLLALLNKEVFAPLPLVMLALSQGRFLDRMRHIAPLAVALIIFIFWRSLMIGEVLGGYNNSISPSNLLDWINVFPAVLVGDEWLLLPVGFALVLATIGCCRRSWRNFLILVTTVTGLVLPFLALNPSTDLFNLRYSFVVWWAVCVFLAVGSARIVTAYHWRPLLILTLASVAICTIVFITHGRAVRDKASGEFVDNFDTIGRFIWEHDESFSYVLPEGYAGIFAANHSWALKTLKQLQLGESAPKIFPIANLVFSETNAYYYHHDCRCMQKMDTKLKSFAEPSRHLELSLAIDRSENSLKINIKNNAGGECILFFQDSNNSTRIPCELTLKRFEDSQFTKIVRGSFKLVVTSSGRWDSSPWLKFPDVGEFLTWSAVEDGSVSGSGVVH